MEKLSKNWEKPKKFSVYKIFIKFIFLYLAANPKIIILTFRKYHQISTILLNVLEKSFNNFDCFGVYIELLKIDIKTWKFNIIFLMCLANSTEKISKIILQVLFYTSSKWEHFDENHWLHVN